MGVTRRTILASGATLAAAAPLAPVLGETVVVQPRRFVTRQGTTLWRDGKPYRFAGANMWYGPWLGAKADYGNRDRLRRELDALKAMGVANLRINASAEDSPLKNSVKPAFRTRGTTYNPVLLDGLDYLLAEMAQRDMLAVLYLTNFWEWSGGMMTYLHWVNGGQYINMNDPAHPWPEFPDFTARFYSAPEAVKLYHDYVRAVVGRTNGITGKPYAEDATIMAWQLANEPRPGGRDSVAEPFLPAYNAWIRNSAQVIKSVDRNHLVSTGSEGLKGSIERGSVYLAAHDVPEVDYLTSHVWPLNWSWVDSARLPETHDAGIAKVAEYLDQHAALAAQLGKPLVFEEFGYPRDGGSYDPSATTAYKDKFYRLVYDFVEAQVKAHGPTVGSNFWAWNGEGRAAHPDHRFRPGDTAWLGDPPHEPQGWYGVFSSDASTQAVIRAHAIALAG